jgi:undecaprenyl phosphate-alpha-L-ara4N flippase subunit ArnE
MGTPISSMVLVLFASVLGSIGAVFLKLGAARLYDIWGLLNWRLGAGVGMYLGSSVFYGWGIKHGQISVLYPMVSLGYVWTLAWGRLIFHERFTTQKFLGLGLILFGVICVAFGSK